MYVRCGYACINTSVSGNFRSFRKSRIDEKDYGYIDEVVLHNFLHLERIVDWNLINNIRLFRISSNIVPFLNYPPMYKYIEGTNMFNRLGISVICDRIKQKIKSSNTRLSIHLIEYTHINSNSDTVMYNGYMEMIEQFKLLKLLGGSTVVMHGGGLYGYSAEYMLDRLYKRLLNIRGSIDICKLAIENDDRTYTAKQISQFTKSIGCNWVFDYHHFKCNPSPDIVECIREHNPIKYHISTGESGLFDRTHANYISEYEFLKLIKMLMICDIKFADIMFEAKAKEKSITNILKPISEGYWGIK